MKSGTTSLFRWLSSHPDVALPPLKEPGFFSDPESWRRGLAEYAKLFAHVEPDQVTGESSMYAGPSAALGTARRIRATIPDVRLIYLLRHPLQRLRSHYRHEVQRGREQRDFQDAVGDAGSVYVRGSLYWQGLAPFVEEFHAEQILVVRFEDLTGPNADAFHKVLDHLGLARVTVSRKAYNTTSAKRQFTPIFRWIWERGLDRPLRVLPQSLKKFGSRMLLRDDPAYRLQLETSRVEPIPASVIEAIWDDTSKLERWMGMRSPLWPESVGRA